MLFISKEKLRDSLLFYYKCVSCMKVRRVKTDNKYRIKQMSENYELEKDKVKEKV